VDMQQPASGRSLLELLAAWRRAVAGTRHPQPPAYAGPDIWITHLTEKTSEVTPGACFVARVRTGSDGHPYIGRAIANGAALIVAQRPAAEVGAAVPAGSVVYLQVEDTAVAYAWLAAAWEGFPSRELVVIGVTGTDGKTSTASMLLAILRAAGLRAGLLSTIKAVIGAEEEPLALHVTTPEAPAVQRYLRRMVDAGLTHCVLETTSHGLAQQRVGAVDFDVAVVTNISHEHFDYHGDYAGYFAAKARLFTALRDDDLAWPPRALHKARVQKTAVLNRDDSSYAGLAALTPPRCLTYALRRPADLTAADVAFTPRDTRFTLRLPTAAAPTLPLTTPLVGEFNVYNLLAAAGAAHALAISPTAIQGGLQAVRSIDGRMERIDRGQPFQVIVDFAHTPQSLEKALGVARGITDGRVIVVFGSAGKRDVAKRRLMPQTAVRLADLTVLTAEDPRTEALDDILDLMVAAATAAGGVLGETVWRVRDRGRAIYLAFTLARPGDLVLICGKGHEQSICFGVTEYPWDDRHAARAALDAFLRGDPTPDLGLPTFEEG
jgi:UDP-N-acetylmuramoyl-L-alanyl-D-glutamate--2,6-diaminopimelate ligase